MRCRQKIFQAWSPNHDAHRRTPPDPPVRIPAARLAGRDRRSRLQASSDADAGARDAEAQAQSRGGRARAAGARRRRADAGVAQDRRRGAAGRPLSRDAGWPHHRAAAEPAVHARDRDAGRSEGQHPALGPLPVERKLLHPVRGRGLPAHHLFPGPAGRDGGLHHADRGGPSRGAGAARQRQPARSGRTARRPAFRGVARSVAEARLPVCAGRRQAWAHRGHVRHPLRPQGRAAHLRGARQGSARHLRDGLAQALDALGRGGVRPRIRSRHLHGGRGVRLQHGRDGEQGPQRLQRQVRAGLARDRDRRRLSRDRGRSSPTSTSTTGPATASPAATGSSSA